MHSREPAPAPSLAALCARKRRFDRELRLALFAAICALTATLLVRSAAPTSRAAARMPSVGVLVFALACGSVWFSLRQYYGLRCPGCGRPTGLRYRGRSSVGDLPAKCPGCGLALNPDAPADPAPESLPTIYRTLGRRLEAIDARTLRERVRTLSTGLALAFLAYGFLKPAERPNAVGLAFAFGCLVGAARAGAPSFGARSEGAEGRASRE